VPPAITVGMRLSHHPNHLTTLRAGSTGLSDDEYRYRLYTAV